LQRFLDCVDTRDGRLDPAQFATVLTTGNFLENPLDHEKFGCVREELRGGGYTESGYEASVGIAGRSFKICFHYAVKTGDSFLKVAYLGEVLFDSHNHLQSASFGIGPEQLVTEMRGVGVGGCVVNATSESDWQAVRGLAERFPDFIRPAYGIHPWFAHTAKAGWEDRLRELLGTDARATVGEVGVDGWVASPSLEIQKPIFSAQVRIAAEFGRNMTVHCLKAWEPLFEVIDDAEDAGNWPQKVLMHSFGGSIEIAERLAKGEMWFSFSGYFLQPRKHKVLEMFKQLPRDRVLIETDAPEMGPPDGCIEFPLEDEHNHPGNLRAIAKVFESKMGAGMLDQVAENGRNFWGA